MERAKGIKINLVAQEIWKLRVEGMTLREVAATLGISHTTVMRRLREIGQVNLPESVVEDVIGKADSKPHQSRLTHESDSIGNRVLQKKTPSAMNGFVTPRRRPHRGPYRGKKEGNSPRPETLVADLIRFLEDKGLEVYRMQNGGYQVKGYRETVRFYISLREG